MGAPTPKGAPTYYLASFSRKYTKMKKFWFIGGLYVPVPSLGSTNSHFKTEIFAKVSYDFKTFTIHFKVT